MMKKIFVSLLFFLFLSPSLAKDACTNPSEYTVDKRCYVTDQQKKQKPYNAVAELLDDKDGWVFCSGTIVKADDDNLYLYTAKHCVINDSNIAVGKLKIKLQNGQVLTVSKDITGNFYSEKDTTDDGQTKSRDYNLSGDWAVYKVPDGIKNIDFVKMADKRKWDVGSLSDYYNAKIIGYGALKIMSDKEIKDFKQKYVRYLKDNGIDLEKQSKSSQKSFGIIDGAVDVKKQHVKKFIEYLKEKEDIYCYNLFYDEELKVTSCKYYSDGRSLGCQTWKGDSGAGIFNDKGNIMGLHTRGPSRMIGGFEHAGSTGLQMFPSNERRLDNVTILE